MPSRSSIPFYGEIADYAAWLGIQSSGDLTRFGVIQLRRSGSLRTPPHRRGFFLLAFGHHGDFVEMLAAAPEQVLAFTGGIFPGSGVQRTQVILFQRELVEAPLASPHNEFPFFYLDRPGRWTLSGDAAAHVEKQVLRLADTAGKSSPYQTARLSAALAALLYDLRESHEDRTEHAPNSELCRELLCRFDDLVAEHFATHHSVDEYAQMLHVSADHLSDEVKARTGRNAKEVIATRLLVEAKHLLSHTSLSIAEIADRLHFSEPTHFTRFFKRHGKLTPREYRLGLKVAPASFQDKIA
ncbi:helix-turn-helix domain-containing protein [Luteolibacter luteus]|uniref:Helix-turn-helix transcriptional regulator n=1 Tax=Luteolibacter luteus TaxID=2728835 RepID=A0A858RF22_9BACT|nr:AraC family transcriptional regulator [Luteolibacter luteus]QJE95164.1 helix-turn-helix transcriptional regulator [Luteolibacter luteus]